MVVLARKQTNVAKDVAIGDRALSVGMPESDGVVSRAGHEGDGAGRRSRGVGTVWIHLMSEGERLHTCTHT